MITANDLKKGMVINFNNSICIILEKEHIKPGKGGAYIQATLRDLRSNKTLNNRFRSQETINNIRLDGKIMQFLYKDGSDFHFMDMDTFETVPVEERFIGDNANYLVAEREVEIEFYGTEPILLNLPPSIDLKIAETMPGEKGNSVSNVQKPATLETGYTLNVPLFIEQGESIKVDTRSGEYLGRA